MNSPSRSKAFATLSSRGLLQVLGGAVCISFAPVLARLSHVDPTPTTFYRMLFGGAFLWTYVLLASRLARPRPGARRQNITSNQGATPGRDTNRGNAEGERSSRRGVSWRAIGGMALACGFFFTLDLEFWHRSIELVGPGMATILANFQVFFLAAYGVLWLGEPMTWRLGMAIPGALAGLWLLLGISPGAEGIAEGAADADTIMGVLLGLATALWYALYILTLRRTRTIANALPLAANMALICVATTLIVGLGALTRGESLAIAHLRGLFVLIVYGLGPQAIGWVLISSGLPKAPASVAGLAMLLQPALAFMWDILFFSRPTGPLGFIGAGLALGSVYLGMRGAVRPTAPPRGKRPVEVEGHNGS